MKISLITVSYNSEKTIGDTINSVLNQVNCDLEYIIVDGKSTDNTLKIIGAYASQISKVLSESDQGIYDAMNKGLALATGDIVGFLNSDDIYSDDSVLAEVVRKFQESDSDAMYGDLVYVSQNNLNKVIRKWKSGKFHKKSFELGWMPPHPTFFVRRHIYQQYGGFNTTLKSAADYELMLRFLYRHEISASYLPKTLVKMRIGGKSNASLKRRILANLEDRQAWKLNGIEPNFLTLWLKPIRKIFQFLG